MKVDLTPSERHVMRLLAENKTSQSIADELHISVKTVQRHRENISASWTSTVPMPFSSLR